MNNKVKKRKHRHRYNRERYSVRYECGNVCCDGTCGIYWACRCGKKRPLNNKVEG